MNSTTLFARRRARLAAGTIAGLALAVSTPIAASAHVTVTPESAQAGSYSVLTFAFSHGCDGSPTTSIAIDIPDGVGSLAPEVEPGWTIERVGAEEGVPTRVVFTADSPIESGLRAAVNVQVKFSEDAEGRTLAFPVLQTCVDGRTAWSEIPAQGEDPHALDAPAPTVVVEAPVDESAHGEAAADQAGHGATAAGPHTGDASAASDSMIPLVPVALGAGGLALGFAALVVAIIALRRSRRV
jgi:uncharacterized protein YcnI